MKITVYIVNIIKLLAVLLIVTFILYLIFQLFFIVQNQHKHNKTATIIIDINPSSKNYDTIPIIKMINNEIDKNYNRSISYLNTSIILFSTSLALFFVLVGTITFIKLKDVDKELSELREFPEKIVSTYNRKQLQKLLNDVCSDDDMTKANALQHIAINPELNENHYDLLFQSFKNEFSKLENNFQFNNIFHLVNILAKINYEKTAEKIILIINDCIENKTISEVKFSNILSFISNLKDTKYEKYIVRYLKIEEKGLGSVLLNHLIMNNNIKPVYLDYVFSEDNVVQKSQFLSMIYNYCPSFDSSSIIDRLLSNTLEEYIVRILLNNELLRKKISFEDKLKVILKFSDENRDKKSTLASINHQFFTQIKEDKEKAQRLLKMIKDKEFYLDFYHSIKPSLNNYDQYDFYID